MTPLGKTGIRRTFVAGCLAGRASLDDLDNWIDQWHDTMGKPWGSPVALAEFLGMGGDEYALYVEQPSALRFIVAAHRFIDGTEMADKAGSTPMTARCKNGRRLERQVMLEGVVGSVAYGLNGPDSDVDYAGIYIEPTEHLLGLHPPSRERATIKGRDGEDATYHELGKAMTLMLSCNPTAMEILWLPRHVKSTAFGEELVTLRSAFLSAKGVRDAFFGYSVAQLRRLVDRGRFQGSLETRREKHARHVRRLLWQGFTLYTTGALPIRLDDPDAYHDFGRRCATDPEARAAVDLVAEYERRFDGAATVLADAPNEPPLEDFLLRVRRAHL